MEIIEKVDNLEMSPPLLSKNTTNQEQQKKNVEQIKNV